MNKKKPRPFYTCVSILFSMKSNSEYQSALFDDDKNEIDERYIN